MDIKAIRMVMSNLNLLSFSLKPFSLVMSHPCNRCFSIFLGGFLEVLDG